MFEQLFCNTLFLSSKRRSLENEIFLRIFSQVNIVFQKTISIRQGFTAFQIWNFMEFLPSPSRFSNVDF